MKLLHCIAALFLASCATTHSLNIAPTSLPAGYPIFVASSGSGCSFGVQDMMGLSTKDLAKWMSDLPDKSRQIDLVTSGDLERCVGRAHEITTKSGFSNIHIRKNGDVIYPSGLRPL